MFPPLVNNAIAANSETPINGLSFDNGVVLLDLTPTTNEFVSSNAQISPQDIAVNVTDPIVRVELRDMNNNVLKQMVNVGGNMFRAESAVQGTEILVTSETRAKLPEGPTEFFRDPNRLVWMYDYIDFGQTTANRHYISTRPGIYDMLPDNTKATCKETISPYDYDKEGPIIDCNTLQDYRDGTLDPSEFDKFVIPGTGKKVNVSDVQKLSFSDTQFSLLNIGGRLKTSNIVTDSIDTKILDTTTWNYRFEFKMRYDVDPDYDNGDPSNLVIGYRSAWDIGIEGYIYKYPKMKVVAITMPPTAKPDLVVDSFTPPAVCIEVGKTETYTYKINNEGASTTKSFKVKVSADDTEVITHSYSSGINTNDPKIGTFNYSFSAAGTKSFTIFVDSNDDIDEDPNESNNSRSFTVAAKSSCGGGNTNVTVTGDFSFSKTTVIWKTNNLVIPENIQVTGGSCSYSSHSFIFTQTNGNRFFAPNALSPQDEVYLFQFDTGMKQYGGNIGLGVVNVQMTVNTTCGKTLIVGPKTFTIIPDPDKKPPTIKIDWFRSGNNTPVRTVTQDEFVDIKVTEESVGVKTRLWDFSKDSWTSGLPAVNHWTSPYNKTKYTSFQATVQGFHEVCATAYDDDETASTPSCSTLYVEGKTPIPIIKGDTSVREKRKLTKPLNADDSFTNVPGRYIDHSRDEWTNWSGPETRYMTPGTEIVELHVYDNMGLKSDYPARHTITVYPDLPPVIEFEYTATMTRVEKQFKNNSSSPDGDIIAQYYVTYGYDRYNNGACNPTETILSDHNNYAPFKPNRVGNYCFRVYAREAVDADGVGGKDAYKDYMVSVINDNPETAFTVTGVATEPMPVNITPYESSVLTGWTANTLDNNTMLNAWSTTSDGMLISPRRNQKGSNNNFSRISLPLGAANYGLSKKVVTPSGNSFVIGNFLVYDLGNGRYINAARGHANSFNSFYLTGVSIASTELSCGGGSYCNSQFRPDLDEVILYEEYSYKGQVTKFELKWSRYKLSSLAMGVTNSTASGFFSAELAGNGYTSSGSVATFSNGDILSSYSRLKFNTDYKEINKSKRTIKSFKYGEAAPYKTDTYDTIPATPTQVPGTGGTGAIWPYNAKGQLDGIMGPMSGTLSDSQPTNIPSDARGNYYSFEYYLKGGSYLPTLVKWDSNSGMPSVIRDMPYNSVIKFVSADGKYVEFTVDGTDNDGNGYTETRYTNLINGDNTNSKPWDYATFLNHLQSSQAYQNGYAIPYNGGYYSLIDAKTGANINEDTLVLKDGFGGKALNSVNFINDTTYSMGLEVYNNVPYTDQPTTSNEPVTFGQLYNSQSARVVNGTVAWNLMQQEVKNSNIHAGVSFRMQNAQNMYRVESHYKSVQLVKIVNGRKTILKKVYRTLISNKFIRYKVTLVGDHIKVYEEGGLAIDVYDGTFANGTMGPYSVSDNAVFKGIMYLWTEADLVAQTPGVAIVDTDVTYDATYTDPEHDPALNPSTQWQYAHVDTTKFLDAGDGKSGLSVHHGQVVTSPILNFDKVGVYKVDYRVPDDPHPDHLLAWGDPTFAEHSKYSDWYTQYLIVHRRPIANFKLGLDGNNFVTWTDYSYDPDRCSNVSNCMDGYQTAQGILHGILKKKFYYITPISKVRIDGKLTKPLESGEYTVAMAVADEYNAWSDWHEETIMIDIPVAPNNPPIVQLTFPNGNYDAPNPVSLLPTIYWNQGDPDPGTIYSTFDLKTKDEWGNCIECVTNMVMDTPLGSWAWTMDIPLMMGQKYQSQVRVSDGEAWSAWSNIGWMATNSPPAAYMSFPYGTQIAPTIVNTERPTLRWNQTDPDVGAIFNYFQIQISNEDNNVMVFDTCWEVAGCKVWQGTAAITGNYAVPIDLPAGQKLRVRVKVWDQYGAESNWSQQTWMMINRGPKADFIWTPQPAFEGDEVTLLNRSTDPDGDALTFSWNISGPAYDSTQTSVNALIPAAATDFHPGDYMVTLTVSDPYGAVDTVTKTIRVGDLQLLGFVKHTAVWEEKRKSYNLRSTGDTERPRPSDMFWSGEAFALEADTNEAAVKVKVSMSYMELRTELSSTNHIEWTGKLQRDDFESLPDHTYTFQFTGVWSNGHTETVNRTVTVKNAWTDFASSVRKE
ncbi:CARDB domain-containing protein [Paenibacillus foliorum]|nr:CARDB domain-containing protein [Paenibacillus foliorum]